MINGKPTKKMKQCAARKLNKNFLKKITNVLFEIIYNILQMKEIWKYYNPADTVHRTGLKNISIL